MLFCKHLLEHIFKVATFLSKEISLKPFICLKLFLISMTQKVPNDTLVKFGP